MKTPDDRDMKASARDPDAVVSAEEQAEASALAQALEERPADTTTAIPREVTEALETATLLAQSTRATVPEPGRVLDAVLPALQARRPRRRWWLWPAIAVPAAATVLFLGTTMTMSSRQSAPAAVSMGARSALIVPRAAPQPSLPLLRAQAELARGNRHALATLDAEMRRYRASFYGSQEAH